MLLFDSCDFIRGHARLDFIDVCEVAPVRLASPGLHNLYIRQGLLQELLVGCDGRVFLGLGEVLIIVPAATLYAVDQLVVEDLTLPFGP